MNVCKDESSGHNDNNGLNIQTEVLNRKYSSRKY